MNGSAAPTEDSGYGRQLRLRVAAEFSEVFAARKVLRGARFAVHYRPNGKQFPRLGLVIPKKRARTAVLRNALKRQARELFRRRRADLPPLDLVLRLAGSLGTPALAGDRAARAAWCAEMAALFDRLPRHPTPGDPT